MIERLYRGKRIDNGEWVYGFYFCMYHDDDRKHLHHFIIPLNVPIPKDKPIGEIQVEVDPDTVGQYTGLTDLHNNPIIEGDIVKGVCYAGKTKGTVTFKNGYYYIHAYAGYCEQLSRCSHMVEVIGNIHDNPELLEDKL